MTLSLSEQLMHSTIRIECYGNDGSGSTGTGFFFGFNIQNSFVPVIVTNNHVVKNMSVWKGLFTIADDSGNPLYGNHYRIDVGNLSDLIIPHPDPTVDLCIIPIAPILRQAENEGKNIFYIPLSKEQLPSKTHFDDEFTAIEDIIMIGYPNGLWDSSNNLPIIRQGITATHPSIDYDSKEEFLIDAACFPGSSGSPVFLYNQGGYVSKTGDINIGNSRVLLLGVLYAGPVISATGEITVVNVPTNPKPIATTNMMMNLGTVIKSKKLNDFKSILSHLL